MLNSKTPDIGVYPTAPGTGSRPGDKGAPSPALGCSPSGAHLAWRWLPLALLAAAAAGLAIDCSLAQWFSHRHYSSHLAELLDISEAFGHGLGVMMLVAVMYQLDVGRRRALPRVLCCSLGAGMAANGIKMLLARTRPRFYDFEEGVVATFNGWFPLGNGGAPWQSFPSAHTATAVGLAVALAWLYPRGRWAFVTLAVMVGCQRMHSRSHYLSDVLVGAAIGLAVGRACLEPGWLARQIARLEACLKAENGPPHDPGHTTCRPAEHAEGRAARADSTSRRVA